MKHGTQIHPKHAGMVFSILALMLITQSLPAQTSIGFRDPQNIKPLLDYRLPDWGYKTLSVDFNLQGSSNNDKTGYSDQTYNKNFQNDLNLSFNPVFKKYHENEHFIRNFEIQFNTRFEQQKQNRDTTMWRAVEMQDNSTALNILSNYTVYFQSNKFILSRCDVGFNLLKSRTTQAQFQSEEYSLEAISNNIYLNAKLGLGIGRVRNVTPQIRAMRFSERYHALHESDSLSIQSLQHIAQAISKFESYHLVYDREDKYFWRDVYSGITEADKMSPFEFNYLAEVMWENAGQRLQGQDISIGLLADLNWNRDKHQSSGSPNSTQSFHEFRYGFFTQASWYRNLDLNQQIGFFIKDELFTFKENSDGYVSYYPPHGKLENEMSLGMNYLYLISDRTIWQNDCTGLFRFVEIKNGDPYSHRMINLTSSIIYYIENNFALTTTFAYMNYRSWYERDDMPPYPYYQNNRTSDFSFSVNLKYYFLRGME